MLGNKGAAYITFKYRDLSLLFINSHLACNYSLNINETLHYYIKLTKINLLYSWSLKQ